MKGKIFLGAGFKMSTTSLSFQLNRKKNKKISNSPKRFLSICIYRRVIGNVKYIEIIKASF